MKIFKKGKYWWLDYTAHGVRRRESTGATNKAEALAFMSAIDVARKMPSFEAAVEVLKAFYNKPMTGLLPIDSIWETYSRLAATLGRDKIKDNTLRLRRTRIERLVEWLHDKRPTITHVEYVSGQIAADYAAHLATKTTTKRVKINGVSELVAEPLTAKARKNCIDDLKNVWNIIGKATELKTNPWTNLAPIDIESKRGKPFSEEQQKRVLAAADQFGMGWPQICRLMLCTGQRYEDIAHLQWKHIGEKSVDINPEKTKRHGIFVTLPRTEEFDAIIATIHKNGDYLFPLHAEAYGSRNSGVRKRIGFRNVLTLAGLEDQGFTVHSWRHTSATRLSEAGVDKETRKLILGHRVDATSERYDHGQHLAATKAALEAAARQKQD